MKVTVDGQKCCGAGACVMTAPEVFDQRDDDGTVVLLDARPPADLHAAVREAADMCPTGAIGAAGEG
ncbi:ferredoxin [Murinocardiopsis flavida]|uniref:Ferredoxin n=1 Tax=Murinocardiopsis flavida TaxID=645275 RepID=A0A2P8DRW1_9ACTN|nr:ferredoxin [Murinocardiopsis flavida]PSK99947.1 ferredoxin [Murinocardiopsis flavida]